MKNGYRQDTGAYAPETAVGTGAAAPIVNEFDAAVAARNVDETTLGASKVSKNKPRANEASDIKPSGAALPDPDDERLSTGEDEETRTNPNAHADDANANKPVAQTRPTAPQAKTAHARPANTPTTRQLP